MTKSNHCKNNPPSLFHHHPESTIANKNDYQEQLKYWQTQLFHVQQAYYHQRKRAIIVFEGWDASGKGGAIRRITERLDPRGFTVYPIGSPSKEEQSKHYLYRFWQKIPAAGTLSIFDRSHYGRVLVERVDRLVDEARWRRAYDEINEFERLLSDDGVRIIKLYMHISADEQRKRFEERLHNPYKRWKLTVEDLHNRRQRNAYIEAVNDMFAKTHTPISPWHVVDGEHKWQARISVLKIVATQLSEGVDITPAPIDEDLVKLAAQQLDIDEKSLKN